MVNQQIKLIEIHPKSEVLLLAMHGQGAGFACPRWRPVKFLIRAPGPSRQLLASPCLQERISAALLLPSPLRGCAGPQGTVPWTM